MLSVMIPKILDRNVCDWKRKALLSGVSVYTHSGKERVFAMLNILGDDERKQKH
jgi:hypothetical protein